MGSEQNRDLEFQTSDLGGSAVLNTRRVFLRPCSSTKDYKWCGWGSVYIFTQRQTLNV